MPAILGPEMAALILWAPGKIAFFQQKDHHAHKIPRFRGGYLGPSGEGGGSADFIFMGARILPDLRATFFVRNMLALNYRAFCVRGRRSPQGFTIVLIQIRDLHGADSIWNAPLQLVGE